MQKRIRIIRYIAYWKNNFFMLSWRSSEYMLWIPNFSWEIKAYLLLMDDEHFIFTL